MFPSKTHRVDAKFNSYTIVLNVSQLLFGIALQIHRGKSLIDLYFMDKAQFVLNTVLWGPDPVTLSHGHDLLSAGVGEEDKNST